MPFSIALLQHNHTIYWNQVGNFVIAFERFRLNLMVISFLQRRSHPVTRYIKKLLTSPGLRQFFIWEGQNANIKKGMPRVYDLLKSVARSLLFPAFSKKKFFLNTVLTNILYYWPCSLNNVVSLRFLHKTLKKLNSKLDDDTRRILFKFHLVAL